LLRNKENISKPTTPFLWQTATPGSCILDPLGQWLLTRGDEPAVRFWQLRDDDGATDFPRHIQSPLNTWLAVDPDRLVVGEAEGYVRAFEKELPRKRAGEVKHSESEMIKCAPSADGSHFFTVGHHVAQAWDMKTFEAVGAPSKSAKAAPVQSILGHATPAFAVTSSNFQSPKFR